MTNESKKSEEEKKVKEKAASLSFNAEPVQAKNVVIVPCSNMYMMIDQLIVRRRRALITYFNKETVPCRTCLGTNLHLLLIPFHMPSVDNSNAPPPTKKPLYEASTQFKNWRYSPDHLEHIRSTLNEAAVGVIRKTFEAYEVAGFPCFIVRDTQ